MPTKNSSRLGFGSWGIGGDTSGTLSYGSIDETTAAGAIRAALKVGISFFDTSPAYGEGRSEKMIGQELKECRNKITIATKVGMHELGKEKNFKISAIEKSLTSSMERLQTDYLDVVQLHDPEPRYSGEISDLMQCFLDLKRSGIIRNIGISLKTPNSLDYWEKFGDFNYLQINFNALDQRALDSNIPEYCRTKKAFVLARTPLAFGFLSDRPPNRADLGGSDHRLRWSSQQFESWSRAADILFDGINQKKTELAIRFCLSFPWVAYVLTGIMSETEAIENAEIANLGPLNTEELEKIKKNYNKAKNHVPIIK
jgi:aryl-alcohol dehydrogenase-like predicted oxidoreductase